ncbi:uncharacterized protein BO72DRAFT_157207 [Aspergillus fijiensis CBS 313.89]|uniref:Uncharacterized protein n=1 Tax=Aspergillus fijiensis CBS 313.89 TaxID=1448319 RepID=A0A8G1RMJ2_9EURO|nr:uncharacterized protein BO72DRAFT_157207 [Aspergillus fijiensis CBS 313.89]RAK75969.1 hypothetical protein BO72DRAFT_157207 [Aspergillus fijiensis CBS 313.89]
MQLRSFLVTSIWVVGSLASPVPETGDSSQKHLSNAPNSRPSFPTVTGHEVHLPCLQCSPEDDKGLVENTTSTPFVAMNLRTEHNALLVNNVSIFPAGYPMQLPAQMHHDGNIDSATVETVLLTYGVDIEYLPPRVDSQVGDIYFVEVKFFDSTGRPATASVIHVRLSRDADEDDLSISQIIIEPLLHYHASHGHGNKVWHAQYWKMLVGKYKSWRKEQKKALHKSLHATPEVHVACGDRPCTQPDNTVVTTDGSGHHRYNSNEAKSPFAVAGPSMNAYVHHHRSNPNFWRLIIPAMVPALLGMVAGLVVCTTGVVVWKIISCALARCANKRAKRYARGAGCCRGSREAVSEKQQLLAREMGANCDV